MKQNKIGEEVNLVNKNTSKASNKIFSLYQNYFLNHYKNFLFLNKKDDNCSSRNRDMNQYIHYSSPKNDSPSVEKLHLQHRNSPIDSNKRNLNNQVNKTKLNNLALNKMSVQICSLNDYIPNIKREREEVKYQLYKMNDYYGKQKRKPFKWKN